MIVSSTGPELRRDIFGFVDFLWCIGLFVVVAVLWKRDADYNSKSFPSQFRYWQESIICYHCGAISHPDVAPA
jgi:hypothetical protein